jgi:hypothetical protein
MKAVGRRSSSRAGCEAFSRPCPRWVPVTSACLQWPSGPLSQY